MADDLAGLYRRMPAKRIGAGLVVRDEHDRVLLVEPTYKPDWEVPGGIVEPDESPLQAVRREVREELGVHIAPSRLWCVDWHPADAPATEGLMLPYDGGRLTTDPEPSLTLPAEELRSWRFATLAEAAALVDARLHRRLATCLARPGATLYLEDGRPVLEGLRPTGQG